MIEYELNGKPYSVSPENEKAFKAANPTATKKQSSTIGDTTVVPKTTVPNQETNLSQINQKEINKSTYTLNNKSYSMSNEYTSIFESNNPNAKLIKKGLNVESKDADAVSKASEFMSGKDMATMLLNPSQIHTFVDRFKTVEEMKSKFNKSRFGKYLAGPPTIDPLDQEITKPPPTIENMQEWAGGKYNLSKEGNLVNEFNKHYEDQPIKLVEARVGRDAVRVIIDDGKGGEYKSDVFYLSGKGSEKDTTKGKESLIGNEVDPVVLEQILNHVNRKTNKQIAEKDDLELGKFMENTVTTEFENTVKGRAEFGEALDKLKGKETPSFDFHGQKVNSRFIPLGTHIDQKSAEVNMEGHIEINGRKYSYQYLWDNREDWRDTRRKKNEFSKGENLIKQKVGSTLPDGSINKFAVGETNEDVDNEIHKRNFYYLGEESQDTKNIRNEIELLKSGKATNKFQGYEFGDAKNNYSVFSDYTPKDSIHIDKSKKDNDIIDISREEANRRISFLEGDLNQYIIDNNIQDLYDENGVIKKIKRDRWIEDPNDSSMMIKLDVNDNLTDETRPKDESDDKEHIKNLADSMTLEELKELRRQAFYRTTYSMQLAQENKSEIQRHINPIIGLFGHWLDGDKDSWDNDMSQLDRGVDQGSMFEVGDLAGEDLNALTMLPGGSEIAKYHNQNLMDFRVLNEAIEMNINPLEANQERIVNTFVNGVSRAMTGENIWGGDYTKAQIMDGFSGVIKNAGFEHEDIENTSFKGGGSKGRHLANLSSNTISSLAPLLLELYVFKSLGGLKAIQSVVGRTGTAAKMGHKLSALPTKSTGMIGGIEKASVAGWRSFKGTKYGGAIANTRGIKKLGKVFTSASKSKWYPSIVNNLLVPAIVTPIEWAAAEQAGEAILSDGSGLWDSHTFHIDKETGDIKTNFLFPAAMGFSGGGFGMLTRGVNNYIKSSMKGATSGARTPNQFIKSGIAKIAPVYLDVMSKADKFFPFRSRIGALAAAPGQGATATFLLTVAGSVEHIRNKWKAGGIGAVFDGADSDFGNSPEGKRLREEWHAMTNMDHVFSTFVAMTALGKGIPKKFRDAANKDMNRFRSETEGTKNADINLSMSENFKKDADGTWKPEDIDNAEMREIEKVEDKIKDIEENAPHQMKEQLIAKEKTKIKSIKESAETLRNRNEIIEIKKSVKAEDQVKRRKQLEKEYFITEEMMSGEKSGADLEVLESLDASELRDHLMQMGIQEGSPAYNQYMYVHRTIKFAGMIAGKLNFGVKDFRENGKVYSPIIQSKWIDFVSGHHQVAIISAKVENLKERMKEEPKRKDEIIEQIKNLSEEKKLLNEKLNELTTEHQKDFEKRLEAKIRAEQAAIKGEKEFYEGDYIIIEDEKVFGLLKPKKSSELFRDKVNEISRKEELEDLKEEGITGSEYDKRVKEIENKEYHTEGMSAFYSRDGRAFIDKGAAIKQHSLTEGTHEINHMLTRDYFKENAFIYDNKRYNEEDLKKLKDSKNKADVDLYKRIKSKGVEKYVFSQKGIDTIDYMLENLTPEERAIVDERMNLNYIWRYTGRRDADGRALFEMKDGKEGIAGTKGLIENNKFDYYEEYMPVLGQAIAKGRIQKGPHLGRNLGKALWPVLKIYNPNLYKFELNHTDSRKAGNDLLRFIEKLYTEGLTENVLAVGRTGGFGEGMRNQKIAASRNIIEIKKEFKHKKTAETNQKLYKKIVDYAKENNIPLGRFSTTKPTKLNPKGIKTFDAVTPEMREDLVKNNKWIAEWLSNHPELGGKGVHSGGVYNEKVRKRFEDDFIIELENLARTFDPSKNTSFPKYVLQGDAGGQKLVIMKKRYAGILDQLIKETTAISISKPIGEKGTIGDILPGERDVQIEGFESQDLSFGIRKKRQRIKEVESVIEQSELRKEIGIEDYDKSGIFESIKSQLLSKKYTPQSAKRGVTTPTKSIMEKGGLKSLENQTEFTIYDKLDKLMTMPELLKHRRAIIDAIPIDQLVQMQKMLPADQKLIKEIINPETKVGKWSTEKALREFMGIKDPSVSFKWGKDSVTWEYNKTGKVLLPQLKRQYESHLDSAEYAEYKRRKGVGVRVYEKLDMNTVQWESYLTEETRGKRQEADKSGTLWNNRNNILRKLSTAITKDAIPEILKDKEFVDKYLTSKDLKGQVEAKALIKKFVNDIGKSESLQFSSNLENKKDLYEIEISEKGLTKTRRKWLAKEIAHLETLQSGNDKIERLWKAALDIADHGAHKVFNLKTKKGEAVSLEVVELTKEFKKKYPDLTKLEVEYLFKELVLKDKIWNHEGLKLDKILKARNAFNKDIIKSGKERSGGFEQWVINNFKKINGIKVLTEIQTEVGDLPDVHAEIMGKEFNIEVKMFKAQLGSLTSSVNAINGIAEGVSTEGFKNFKKENRDKINFLLKETTTEWKKIRKAYIELAESKPDITSEHKNLLKNFKSSKDHVPKWAYEILRDRGNFIKMSKLGTGEFTETLIEDIYKNKKHPSSYMYWLGRGMFFMGKNPHGLNIPKLEGTFIGQWRYDTHSVKSVYGREHNLVTTNLRFIPIAKNITSKSKVDILTKEGRDALSKDINNPTTVMSSRAIENHKKVVIASKSIENVRKFINTGEKKGMSTFDFDDTLARTKSGVRYTLPNPSGKPAPKKKVIFLAGGAGSGKSNVIKQLGLEKQGFKIVNQDISLEWLAKNHGLPTNMRDFTPEQASKWGSLQWEARDIAQRKQIKFQGKGDGIIVDGTGASKISMGTQVMKFRNKGYDVQMIFVETSLPVALARNRARKERSLKSFIVERNHKSVMANKKAFKEDFGENFAEVNTDNLKQGDPMPKDLISKLDAFTKGYIKGRLNAGEFAHKGERLKNQGAEFDFSEFNKVVEGEPGPYLKTALDRAKKFGTKDMFVLTARPAESAKAIHEFLKEMGLNIPIKNITGLANSTGNAKAKWMLEKFAEGYNDMYFVDDAFANVDAVKKVLDQLDIKSKVVQAKVQASRNLSETINEMIERKSGFKAEKEMSLADAKAIGRGKGRFDFFVPPSAEDFKGLMYKLLGKGKKGDADMKFFKKSLFDPFAVGIRDLTIVKQKMSDEYKALKKNLKDVKLNKKIEGTNFTVDNAIRMYLWEKAGFEVPGISEGQRRQLVDHVNNNPKLVNFAETLSAISRLKEGYNKPEEYWMVENIASDLNNLVKGQTRKDFLAEWIENKNTIFSKENLNKIEAAHGSGYREALENILYRMETGTNRLTGKGDTNVNRWYDWINGSVGATMFWNTRSAVLQTISTVNFTNWAENNPLRQAQAFANQPQFWKDFAFIMNSPMLKQRRSGLQIDVSASELTSAFESGNRNPQAILQKLLQWGFTPTRIADSFAIAMGGSTFYRNRLNMYKKRGLSEAKAKEKAWLDFQEIAEQTQQSSRPDLISQQQAGPLGRIILAWANTPMQMTRLSKKALSDLVNNRGSKVANMSRLTYYMAMQNLWFYTLQSGLGWLMFGSDQEELIKKKELAVLNGSFDTLLRGTGIYGAAASTIKNTIFQYQAQKKKGFLGDQGKTIVEAIGVSPPIGTKVRKAYSSINSWTKFDAKGVGEELGLRIENPNIHAVSNIIEAATNVPLARVVNKANNLEEAITGNHEWWQRAAMFLGWSRWNVGARDEELDEAKAKAKAKKIEERKIESNQKKIDKKKKEEEQRKKEGYKTIRCSGIKSSGGRCSLTTETKAKSWKCGYHKSYKPNEGSDRDNDGVKEYQCKAYTKSKKRCKNRTENKSKKCYAHQ